MVAEWPFTRPRLPLDTVLPSVSLAAIEATPRARLKTVSSAMMSQPARSPRIPASPTLAISRTQSPSTTLLHAHQPLRTG